MILYYAAIQAANGERLQGVFTTEELRRATFRPDDTTLYITNMKPRTRDEAVDIAQAIQHYDADTVDNGGNIMPYSDLADIGDAMLRAARRFGLVREFRGNGII